MLSLRRLFRFAFRFNDTVAPQPPKIPNTRNKREKVKKKHNFFALLSHRRNDHTETHNSDDRTTAGSHRIPIHTFGRARHSLAHFKSHTHTQIKLRAVVGRRI